MIKKLPNQPGKEFEIRKRLGRLKGIKRFPKDNNNDNNNNSNNDDDNFPPPVVPISPPYIDPFPPPGPGLAPPPVVPISPPYIDPFPPPGPSSAPGSGPGFSPPSFNPFQQPPQLPPPPPPSTDAFPSRGRYDPPPPPAPSIKIFKASPLGHNHQALLVYLAHKQLPLQGRKKMLALKMI